MFEGFLIKSFHGWLCKSALVPLVTSCCKAFKPNIDDKMTEIKPGKTILGSSISHVFFEEVKKGIGALKKCRASDPYLVGFLANQDPAAEMYAMWTSKTCESLGVRYELRRIDDRDSLEGAIIGANMDDDVDGIMVYFPVFGGAQDTHLQQIVCREKDVEGLNNAYFQNLYDNIRFLDGNPDLKSILPCTPLAIVKILEYLEVYNKLLPEGNRLFGKKCLIINRSEIVGRPLAALLANDGANVVSVSIDNIQQFTRGEGLMLAEHQVKDLGEYSEELLKDCSKDADIIITGVPSDAYKFPTSYIKDGAVCINFSFHKNFEPSVKSKASLYVPSTGKVTIAILLRNMLRLIENKKRMSERL